VHLALAAAGPNPRHLAQGAEIPRIAALTRTFYKQRDYRPAWSRGNRIAPLAKEFLDLLDEAGEEGLNPADYGVHVLREAVGALQPEAPTKALEALDPILTDTFFLYAIHLSTGRVDTSEIDLPWITRHRSPDLPSILEDAVESGSLARAAAILPPPQGAYRRLKRALVRYRGLEATGGWPVLPPGPTIKPENRNDPDRLALLERRLHREGYLAAVRPDSVLTERLMEGVRAFQRAHGLEVDGRVGPYTRRELNVPAVRRIEQIIVNMERWRWYPESLGPRRLEVNIPGFTLTLYENDRPDTTMRVVVGINDWETPVFSDSVRYVVFNPYWNVPKKIAVESVLTGIREDSTYLASKDFEVFSDWGRDATLVEPATVDWSEVDTEDFPYRFRQKPGAANALGRMKFMFPNRFSVYLHDTPSVNLFRKWNRTFSHGCVRVEDPFGLAAFAFAPDSTWNRARFEKTLRKAKRRIVSLPEPLPIHLMYWTAMADDSGRVVFYRDVYGVDRQMRRALARR